MPVHRKIQGQLKTQDLIRPGETLSVKGAVEQYKIYILSSGCFMADASEKDNTSSFAHCSNTVWERKEP